MIKIDNLSKVFKLGFFMKEKIAVDNLSLNVEEGSIYGFVGPNGAGKSTTIKMLLGLLRKSSGQFSVLGKDGSDVQTRHQIGYLPEQPYFYDYLSGYELLEFYGKLLDLNGPVLKERIEWALGMVHANQDWVHSKLRSYSKGMMQRVGLAQAILNKPKLLILDEPMSGLDPVGRRDVRNTILELNKMGTTIFYSSHVLSDVEAISRDIGIIINGKMRTQGKIEDVLSENEPVYIIKVFNSKDDSKKIGPLIESSRIIGLNQHDSLVYEATNRSAKDQLIKLLTENQVSIENVELKRPSLEDVLTREIAKGA